MIAESVLVRASGRQTTRRAAPVTCCVVRESDGRIIGRRGFDLSPEGMRVELLDFDVDRGDFLHVCFQATQLQKWFYTDAIAARVLQGRRPQERGRSLGLRFESLDAISRLILRGALRKVPPVLPVRERRIDYAATLMKILAS
jgi:hypothetical protein